MGGIIACGAAIAVIGLIVQMIGVGWIESSCRQLSRGAVVAVIGLNLAGIPIKNMAPTPFDAWMQAVTFICVGLVAVYTKGLMQRLLILVGLIPRQRGLRDPHQRHGPRQTNGLVRYRQRRVVWRTELRVASV